MKRYLGIKAMYQCVTEGSLESFRTDLLGVDFSDIYSEARADSAYDLFLDAFTHVYNKHFVPKLKRLPKTIRKPWISRELYTRIKEKHKLYQLFIDTKDTLVLERFKKCRNKLNSDIRQAKLRHYENYFAAALNRPDKIWRKIRSLDSGIPQVTTPDKITSDGIEYSGNSLAEKFNNFFTAAPKSSADTTHVTIDRCPSSLFLEPVSTSEILSTFRGLKNSTSCDAENIQIRPVKHVIDIIAAPLEHIYNLCLETATFPRDCRLLE